MENISTPSTLSTKKLVARDLTLNSSTANVTESSTSHRIENLNDYNSLNSSTRICNKTRKNDGIDQKQKERNSQGKIRKKTWETDEDKKIAQARSIYQKTDLKSVTNIQQQTIVKQIN